MNLIKIPQIPGLNFPWKISGKILEIYKKVSNSLQPYVKHIAEVTWDPIKAKPQV